MAIYSQRILSRKNVLLVVLVFFLISIYLAPVKRFSVIANESVTPWILPFLLTDTNFLILFMVAVIYYFSNVPFTNGWTGYYLLRSGKERWRNAMPERTTKNMRGLKRTGRTGNGDI